MIVRHIRLIMLTTVFIGLLTVSIFMGISSVRVPGNSVGIPPEAVTLSGTYQCLSEGDAPGLQTEECAFGLMTDGGIRYAVNFGPAVNAPAAFQNGAHVTVEGFIADEEDFSTNRWAAYDLRGRFTITKVLNISKAKEGDSLIQKDTTTRLPDAGTSFKHCAVGMAWICGPVSQGMESDPRHPPAEVCGCGPARCPSGEHRITNAENGTWPDGTSKGSSVCSSEYPPGAETPPSR